MWYRLRDEGVCWRHSGRQASQTKLCQTGHQEGDVCTQQTRGTTEYWSVKRIHDVTKQTAFRLVVHKTKFLNFISNSMFRMFLGQGAVLPRGDNIRQCPHSGEWPQTVAITICSAWYKQVAPRSKCQAYQSLIRSILKVAKGVWSFVLDLCHHYPNNKVCFSFVGLFSKNNFNP